MATKKKAAKKKVAAKKAAPKKATAKRLKPTGRINPKTGLPVEMPRKADKDIKKNSAVHVTDTQKKSIMGYEGAGGNFSKAVRLMAKDLGLTGFENEGEDETVEFS